MHALHDVVKAGWVRYVGMSSCYAWQCTHLILGLSILVVLSAMFQFPQCRVRSVSLLHLDFIPHECRLRHQQQAHALHINAKSLQPHLS